MLIFEDICAMQQIPSSSQAEVLQLSGHINASNADDCQRDLLQTMSASAADTFIADLRHVESLDSAGLMALVAALNFAQEQGKAFSVANVSDSLRIIFELTQLDQAFEIEDSDGDKPRLGLVAA